MSLITRFEKFYHYARQNKWFGYFTVFCRIALALGFIPSGYVKVMGERFTALPPNHPLGHYFDALYVTGYYYPFVGAGQLLVAALLLIPRTALLGALMGFPIMLNICVLSYAVRFEGTRIITVMLLAYLYLLCWDYARIRYILPIKHPQMAPPEPATPDNRFPWVFFGCVFAAVASVIVVNQYMYDIRPGNSPLECTNGCSGNDNPEACARFCDCIYNQGKPLETCLNQYETATKN